jgi:dTDP-4-amino-4,6-dideoxygalactose transaminase
VTKDFEKAIGEYTDAPYVVAVNSCTMALLLAVAWHIRQHRTIAEGADRLAYFEPPWIEIPKRTYVSVPMSIIHAGGRPTFRDEDWVGSYRLNPLEVWDSARWFTSGMYGGGMVCVSFHAAKTLGIEQGGAILLDDPEAEEWLRRARFDGRKEGVTPDDQAAWGGFTQVGWHCYMNPSTAAQGLLKLHSLPRHNAPLPNDDYPDLSQMEIFK